MFFAHWTLQQWPQYEIVQQMLTFDGEMTTFRANNKKTLVNKAHFCYVPMRVTNSVVLLLFSLVPILPKLPQNSCVKCWNKTLFTVSKWHFAKTHKDKNSLSIDYDGDGLFCMKFFLDDTCVERSRSYATHAGGDDNNVAINQLAWLVGLTFIRQQRANRGLGCKTIATFSDSE